MIVEVFITGHVARNVPCRVHLIFMAIALRAPAVELATV
jgi:hypothetical protein